MKNNYFDIVNFMKDMDAVLFDNNEDINVDCYEIIDISSVQIQNNFLYGGY